MSASLVGSEMCIRDRSQPAPISREQRRRRVRRAARLRDQLSHLDAPEGAVSYTHLTLPTICSV
eukprot:12845352-Alexandrium_andersonii.AAC.1